MRKEKGKGCCKNKVVIASLFSLVMLIALALGVNAVPQLTLNTVTWQENTRANISTKSANDDSLVNMSFITLRFSATDTANSTSLNLVNITNTTATNFDLGYANFTFGNNIILEDTAVGVVTGVSTGLFSANATILSATTVTIDRTMSQVPTTLQPTARQTSRTQTIQAIVNNANTTSCRLTFNGANPGSLTYTMTYSGANCSQTFSNLAGVTFKYTVSASDGTNRSAESAEATFYVDIAGSSGARKYIAATGGGRSLPLQASPIAQQRAFGQQAESTLDKVIAKAPANAQEGLMNAKEAVTKQYKGVEAVKTWSGTGVGCAAGFFVVPVIGLIPGCIVGHLVGTIV